MEVERLRIVLLEFRPESIHVLLAEGAHRTVDELTVVARGRSDGAADGRVLIPGAVRELFLIAGREGGLPAVGDLLTEREPPARDALDVVVPARISGVVGDGAVDPLTGGVDVVDVAAVIIPIGRKAQCRPVGISGMFMKPSTVPFLVPPSILPPLRSAPALKALASGLLVTKRSAPAIALAPNVVPCGPFRTSIRSMS